MPKSETVKPLAMPVDVYRAWLSGGVNRWHTQDNPLLRNSGDTNWSHSARVAALVHLFGGTQDDVLSALFHDAGEKITGDKRDGSKNPDDYKREEAAARSLGLYYPKSELVHLCDKLDALLWAYRHGSGRSLAWQESRANIMQIARSLNLMVEVGEVLRDAERALPR